MRIVRTYANLTDQPVNIKIPVPEITYTIFPKPHKELAMSLEESNILFNERNINYEKYSNFVNPQQFDNVNLNLNDGIYITYPNGYVHDSKAPFIVLYNKVLRELKLKFNNIQLIPFNSYFFNSLNVTISDKDAVEIPITDYLEQYINYRNTCTDFEICKDSSAIDTIKRSNSIDHSTRKISNHIQAKRCTRDF
jgi:hypothetical protein